MEREEICIPTEMHDKLVDVIASAFMPICNPNGNSIKASSIKSDIVEMLGCQIGLWPDSCDGEN